jgi:hypothetical protein
LSGLTGGEKVVAEGVQKVTPGRPLKSAPAIEKVSRGGK